MNEGDRVRIYDCQGHSIEAIKKTTPVPELQRSLYRGDIFQESCPGADGKAGRK